MTPVSAPARRAGGRRIVTTVLLAATALLLAGCAAEAPQDALDPAGPVAEAQDRLWNLVFSLAVAVFVGVQTALIIAIVRYRRRRDDDGELPKQVEGNTAIEVVWTLIPAVILAIIAVPTVQTIFQLSAEPDEDERFEVEVTGHQYWFEIAYPETADADGEPQVVTANELHVPTGRPILLHLRASDVIHSLWVPRLAGKTDMIPGAERSMTIEAPEPGVYLGQCGHYCGLSHSRMQVRVIAQEPDEFEAWLAEQAGPADEPDEPLAMEGMQVYDDAQCWACHVIEGADTAGGEGSPVGPDLTRFASRDWILGAYFENEPETVREWIRDPQQLKEGAQMPAHPDMSDDELDALVEYLYTLE